MMEIKNLGQRRIVASGSLPGIAWANLKQVVLAIVLAIENRELRGRGRRRKESREAAAAQRPSPTPQTSTVR